MLSVTRFLRAQRARAPPPSVSVAERAWPLCSPALVEKRRVTLYPAILLTWLVNEQSVRASSGRTAVSPVNRADPSVSPWPF